MEEKKVLYGIITECWALLKKYRFDDAIKSNNDDAWERFNAEQKAISQKYERQSPEQQFCNELLFAVSAYIANCRYQKRG